MGAGGRSGVAVARDGAMRCDSDCGRLVCRRWMADGVLVRWESWGWYGCWVVKTAMDENEDADEDAHVGERVGYASAFRSGLLFYLLTALRRSLLHLPTDTPPPSSINHISPSLYPVPHPSSTSASQDPATAIPIYKPVRAIPSHPARYPSDSRRQGCAIPCSRPSKPAEKGPLIGWRMVGYVRLCCERAFSHSSMDVGGSSFSPQAVRFVMLRLRCGCGGGWRVVIMRAGSWVSHSGVLSGGEWRAGG